MSEAMHDRRRRARSSGGTVWRAGVLLVFGCAVAVLLQAGWTRLMNLAPPAPASPASPGAVAAPASRVASIRFETCHGAGMVTCVVDGDTFRIRGETIRIGDIDTPETVQAKCADEARRGHAATDRLVALLNAGPFDLAPWPGRDTDRYGRRLRIVRRDGASLGQQLVVEGLARTWTGRRQPWC